ncbi:MAG: DEAD/DEAH box helicase [Bacilli bacterium]|nr:DEAD/DEAH box helicase [Bacilli bacterium]
MQTFKGIPYCSRCFAITNGMLQRTLAPALPKSLLHLDYPLSEEQKRLSDKAVDNYKNGIDTLLYAVCGSGKTEVSFGLIDYGLRNGLKVGFGLPRRDVVIELYERLKKAFPTKKVVAVYGGHARETDGDIIVLTTHQLFRYYQFFDMMVMDEVDAFPYAGNPILERNFHLALKGHCLLMSATPSVALVKEYREKGHDIMIMHTRFHNKPIPVPKALYIHGPNRYRFLFRKLSQYKKEKKPTFIFVPTVEKAERLYRVLSSSMTNGEYVTSKREGREKIIDDFKQGKYDYLVTTAILERGVTVKNLNVIVFEAAHDIYDAASLVQIAGRAGRKIDAPYGEVYFIADKETEPIRKAISEIAYCNTFLSGLQQGDRRE